MIADAHVQQRQEWSFLLWYNQAMKKALMEILVCPVCKGKLELTVSEENASEIVNGSLYCGKCRVKYPIEDTIPSLLPPQSAQPGK